MLYANALTKDYGPHRALDDVNFTVESGEIYSLLGANGAGKSTTIKLFLGFLKPTSGCAEVDGFDPQREPQAVRRRLLYIPETVGLYDELTGYENLDYFARLAGVEDRSPARLRESLTAAGLASDAFNRRVGRYSKGMRQKVGIALAIIKEAKALLLDEPSAGLDPEASVEFHDLLLRQRDRGAAVLMATHDLFRAREVATRRPPAPAPGPGPLPRARGGHYDRSHAGRPTAPDPGCLKDHGERPRAGCTTNRW